MVFRLDPQLPAHARKTYAIIAPKSSHFRPASCEEVGCPRIERGWLMRVDEQTDLGQAQAHYIRTDSGRAFRERKDEQGLTNFTFTPGQQCFAQHKVRLGKPDIFVVRDGDFRGNPRGTEARIHTRPEDWVDEFATHQDKLATRLDQG